MKINIPFYINNPVLQIDHSYFEERIHWCMVIEDSWHSAPEHSYATSKLPESLKIKKKEKETVQHQLERYLNHF